MAGVISADDFYAEQPTENATPPAPSVMSFEDFAGPDAAAAQAAAEAPSQPTGPQPAPGPLANAPDDTEAESWLKFGLSSAKRGIQSIPGMIGDVEDLTQMGIAGAQTGYDYLTGGDSTFADNLDAYQKLSPRVWPNSEDIGNTLFSGSGEYEPETSAGRVGGAMIEAVTGGVSPASKGRILTGLGKDALTNSLAGAAAQETVELTGSGPAAIAAALATGAGTNAGIRTFEKEAPGMNLAGRVANEAAYDSMAAAAQLRATEDLLPGVNPTSSQRASDPGLMDLERRLAALDAKESGGNNASVDGQIASSRDAMDSAASIEAQSRARDLPTEYGIGTNARTNASADAANVFDAFEKSKKAEVNAAWNAPNLNSARVFTKRAANNITQYVGAMSVPNRGAIPPDIMKDVKEIVKLGPQTKLTEWQDLRSKVLGRARETENPNVKRILGEFADVIGNTLGDETNIVFKNADAIDEWKLARQATSEYHELFTNPSLKGVTKGKVADEDTLRNLLSGGKAGDNIDALRRAVGPNADEMIQNFLIGEMTNNGARGVSLKNIDDFVGKRGSIIDRIPGMKDRVDGIRSSVASNNLSNGLDAALGDPKKLAAFVDKNRDAVNALSPSERTFYEQLEASAKRLSPAPSSRAAGTKTLDKMQANNVFDLIYSVASGNGARGASVGAAVGTLAGGPVGGIIGLLAGGAGGAVGNGRARARAMEILQEARTNPELMAKLLEKPTAESVAAGVVPGAARVGVQQGAQAEDEEQQGFADGGLVGPEHFDGGGIVKAINGLMKAREDAVKGAGALSRIKAHTDAPTGVIDDWKWRPLEDVHADLGGMDTLPDHINSFGDYMGGMVNKAQAGDMSARDLVKAYTITRSSIQRGAVDAERLKALGLPVSSMEDKIRPEGAFADWLGTGMGQQYLDRASRGIVDADSIRDAQRIHAPFGKADTDLPDALTWAANNLPGREASIGDLVARAGDMGSAPQEWREAVKGVRGIGPSKAGFFASVLGRGDMPTLDARQVILHSGNPTKEGSKFIARRGGLGGVAAVDRLAERQGALGLMMPENYEPFRQHLTHHAIWDKASDEATTHSDIINAMTNYADGGLVNDGPESSLESDVINAMRNAAAAGAISPDNLSLYEQNILNGKGFNKGKLVKASFLEILKLAGITDPKEVKEIAKSYNGFVSKDPSWTYEGYDTSGTDLLPKRTVDIADLQGKILTQMTGDKTNGALTVTKVGGRNVGNVDLQAGSKFAHRTGAANPDNSVWASHGNVVDGYEKRINAATQGFDYFPELYGANSRAQGDLVGAFNPMGDRASDFSTMPVDLAWKQMKKVKLTEDQAKEVDALIRRYDFNPSAKKQKAEDWVGIKSRAAYNQLMGDYLKDGQTNTAPNLRKAVMGALSNSTLVNKLGLPEAGQFRFAATDPDLLLTPEGMMGNAVVKFDPARPRITNPQYNHGSYAEHVGGESLGGLEVPVPRQMLMRDWHKNYEMTKAGPQRAAGMREDLIQGGMRNSFVYSDNVMQKVDQQLVDEVSKYVENQRR